LQCNFKQEKHSSLLKEPQSTTGIMYFQKPESLRWEYTSAAKFVLITSENKTVIINEKGEKIKNDKMFAPLSKLIIGVISGKELESEKNFKAECFASDKTILIVLNPISKQSKAMFSSIELTIDKTTNLAKTIKLNEKNDDFTIITFSNHKKNQAINAQLFKTN
jgi:outer membrane lipoprotein-sorting protein